MEHPNVIDPESAAHRHRAGVIARKVAVGLRLPAEKVLESAAAFDEAVEFATLEGVSVAQAIAVFLAVQRPSSFRSELARIITNPSKAETHVLSLPVMPKLISRLLRTSSEDMSPAQLENMTASDPVLAGKILGAANSALFGSQYEIVRLRDAIMRLGIPESRRILLAACLGGLFGSRLLQELWEHSQTVAADAAELANPTGVDPETAFVSGLLHDIGRFVFVRMPADLRIREQDWLANGFPLCYAETLAYGLDHAEMGAQCLRRWELPNGIVDAVRLHHRPMRSGPVLNAILTLAEDVARKAANRNSEDLWPEMRRAAALLNAGLKPEQVDALHRPLPSGCSGRVG